MASVTKHVDAMVKRDAEIATAYNEVQQSLLALGQQTEGESISFGFSQVLRVAVVFVSCCTLILLCLLQLAGAVEQVYNQAEKHVEGETINFLEPLQEYSRMLASIKASIGHRQDKKSAYVHALGDVEAKQAAHRKVMGVAGKESQAKAKEQAVINAQDTCDHVRKEFEKVTERLLTEFEFFKSQKGADLKETLLTFVSAQVMASKTVMELILFTVPYYRWSITAARSLFGQISCPKCKASHLMERVRSLNPPSSLALHPFQTTDLSATPRTSRSNTTWTTRSSWVCRILSRTDLSVVIVYSTSIASAPKLFIFFSTHRVAQGNR